METKASSNKINRNGDNAVRIAVKKLMQWVDTRKPPNQTIEVLQSHQEPKKTKKKKKNNANNNNNNKSNTNQTKQQKKSKKALLKVKQIKVPKGLPQTAGEPMGM